MSTSPAAKTSPAAPSLSNLTSIPLSGWPTPCLPGTVSVPKIPASILPGAFGDMAQAVSESTQTPSALACMLSLPVLSACVQGRFEISPFGDESYREPLSVWSIVMLKSGSRKTAVHNALIEPLVRWETQERHRLQPEINHAYALRKVIEARIKKLTADAAAAKTSDDRQAITRDIEREKSETPAEIHAPRLFSGDVTAERLQSLLMEQDGRLSVLSDEGGIFSVMGGLYNGGQYSLDVFLQGHAGTALRVDRAGRVAHLDRPALSFGIAMQPGVYCDVASPKRFRDSGLLARFLFAVPRSNIGERDVRRRAPIPEAVVRDYDQAIQALLEGYAQRQKNPVSLTFSNEARERWLRFAQQIEDNQGEGGPYESICDWSSKLAGATARLSCLFELAHVGNGAQDVSLSSVERAISLSELLIPHAQAAFRMLGADDAEDDALTLLSWIKRNSLHEFNRSTAQKALEGRFRKVEQLVAAASRLKEWHVLREEARRNVRARPSTVYTVNPSVFFD